VVVEGSLGIKDLKCFHSKMLFVEKARVGILLRVTRVLQVQKNNAFDKVTQTQKRRGLHPTVDGGSK
jgi:hypothetical protein